MSELAGLEREKRRAQNKNNLREVANLCNLLGQELQRRGDYEAALDQHREEAGLCDALEDVVGKAVSHRRLGEVYCDMGDWNLALQHQNQHLRLAKDASSLVEEQRAYATIGRTHLQQAEDIANPEGKEKALKDAEEAFKQALIACNHLKREVGTVEHCQMRCWIYLNLGLVLDLRGNTTRAREFINQAVDISDSQNLYDDAQRCHVALGAILLREGLITQALQEGQRVLALTSKLRDKALNCEAHSFLAHVHLQNSSYEAAKKSYYKAYKLKHPDLSIREQTTSNLKTVVNICSAEDTLLTLGETEGDKRIKLYEQLGDGAANLCLYTQAIGYYNCLYTQAIGYYNCLYTQAIGYYNKMLELTIKLDKGPSFLAPAYLSLARTYSDIKQFKEAKAYYEKEYNIRLQEDYSEACKTLLNIAVVSEELEESNDTLSQLYVQARDLAIKAKNPKLEAYVLHQHISLKTISDQLKLQLESDMKKIIEEHNLDPEVELSEDEENEEDHIDLDLVHFSDSDNEAEDLDRPRQARQKRALVVKRNEKGETPLHKACIDGNLNMVRKLLQQSHPVNLRDNCGWLPLHEAANHGYCEIVEALLDAGAWISDRGGQQCDGVTPIHDAAGAGNFDVVRLLLRRGASVTAKTDEGDTPLESLFKFRLRTPTLSLADEEDCNHLERKMKEKMEQAGHNIPQLPSSTLDHLPNSGMVRSRRSRNSEIDRNTSDKVRVEPLKPRRRSHEEKPRRRSNEEVGHSSSRKESEKLSSRNVLDLDEYNDETNLNESLPNLNQDVPLSPLNNADLEENSEEFVNPHLEDLQFAEKSATGTYLSAMGCVGSSARRVELQKTANPDPSMKNKKVALVSEVENVGDDWLDDDLGLFTKKRKRTDKYEFDYREPARNKRPPLSQSNSQATPHSHQSSSQAKPLSCAKKVRQTKITSIFNRYSDFEGDEFNISEDEERRVDGNGSTATRGPAGNNSSVFNRLSGASNTGMNTPGNVGGGIPNVGANTLRLRVRVQDRLWLVPVAGGGLKHTVGWLAEEVTRRYYQLTGLRPNLSLATQDRAVLDTSDLISLVLPGEQGELVGQVTGWDLPPLPERYTQACQALGSHPISSLTSALTNAQVSTMLDLNDADRLTSTHLQPVLRAVQYQHSLRCLCLANCRLDDEGFVYLMKALPSLPALEALDLTASSITTNSLLELANAISPSKLSLKSLCSLDLSYNTLSGAKASTLATLFKLPALTTLSLKHCNLNLTSDQQVNEEVTSVLQHFSLDFNTVSCSAFSSLLACLPNLLSLTLSSIKCPKAFPAATQNMMRLGTSLSGLLGGGQECRLQILDLSYCDLCDADVEDLRTYLYRCPHLTTINLAHNPSLSSASITGLLGELTTNLILPLSSLSLHGNKNLMCGAEEKLLATFVHKAATNHAFTNLSFTPLQAATRIEDVWKAQHQERASVKRIGSEVLLSCSDSKA